MRAATTKIPHSLCEKTNLKTPNGMYDFIYNMHNLFARMLYDGYGRKIPEMYKNETKEKTPHWVDLPPPVYEIEDDCFPVSNNNENKPNLP